MNSVKPKSQLDKRLDGFSGGGTSYLAGEGLSLNQNVFELNQATQATLGGIRVSAYATAPEDSSQSEFDSGIYKADPYNAFLGLRRATKKQMGGIYLGDGLAPTVEQSGETYTNTGHVEVRIGEALEFIENDETTEDVKEKRQNNLGGRAVAVTRATGEKFGSVKLGKRIGVDVEGAIYPVMSGKNGIEVSDNGEISALVDEETIIINGEGKLVAMGGSATIENAIILTEETLPDFVHSYEVKYVGGNKIILAEQKTNIVVQGITAAHANYKTSGHTFTNLVLNGANSQTATATSPYEITVEVYSRTDTTTTFRVYVNGNQIASYLTYSFDDFGVVPVWSTIYNDKKDFAPYGYVYLEFYAKTKATPTADFGYQFISGPSRIYYPFISEDELNSAICLDTQENVMATVTETVTEV